MKVFIAVIGRSNRECHCALGKDDIGASENLLKEYDLVVWEHHSNTNVNVFGAIYKRKIMVKYSPGFEEEIAKYSDSDRSLLRDAVKLAQKTGNPDILSSALKVSKIDVTEFTRNT